MTPITRISRLRNCGIFRDFAWPNDLQDFGRFNLIYGWNWSGKTTLSRVFQALENRTAPDGEVALTIGGKSVAGTDFANQHIHIRVFNRDFVEASVFRVDGENVSPIFVVGEESVEKQKSVEELKAGQVEAQETLENARSAKSAADAALHGFCANQARVIKDTLRLSGSDYNDYNKNNFQTRADQMAQDKDKLAHHLAAGEREQLLAQHRGNQKPVLLPMQFQFPALQHMADVVSGLLADTVASQTIQALESDSELSSWLHVGLGLHRGRDAEACLFCEQSLPNVRLAALDAHFSTEYEQLLKRIEGTIGEIEAELAVVGALEIPSSAEVSEALQAKYKGAEVLIHPALDSAKDFLGALVSVMKDKQGQLFKNLTLGLEIPDVDTGVVDRLNEVIHEHNQACKDFKNLVITARRRLEADSVADNLDEFLELKAEVRKHKAAINQADPKVGQLRSAIAQLEKEIVAHRKPAEEMNTDLQSYLGHKELCLETMETGYSITRDGVPAKRLSEGEATAIALLYFLKSLEDHRFHRTNGVVVLDDPVSSLDDNALYLAFGFIRERTQDAAQLFILTHNFTFFRLVRSWLHKLKGRNKRDGSKHPARFYMLDCAIDDDGRRCSSIRRLDRLLEQFESEYHYLFDRIYRVAHGPPPAGLGENYILPNIARRVLETFLAFRQPSSSAGLKEKLENVHFEQAKKLRLLRFVHTHSHAESFGTPEHDPSILSETPAVLNDLLDLIRSEDQGHYSEMEKLVTQDGDDE